MKRTMGRVKFGIDKELKIESPDCVRLLIMESEKPVQANH